MKTKLIYYQDPYKKELTTTITSINQTPDGKWNIQLEASIFYPEGGGQPGDSGELTGPNGKAILIHQKIKDEKLLHVCDVTGSLSQNDSVECKLDWPWRYKYMKIHTAGHLVHDTLMTMVKNLTPTKGGHGKKAYIEYQGEVDPQLKDKLETTVNDNLQKNLTIKNGDTTAEKLAQDCPYVPPNLPKNKPLRYIKIAHFPPMPDGGVHVKSTQEIGRIRITSLQSSNNNTKVTYQIINSS